jgi:hypothetical protein
MYCKTDINILEEIWFCVVSQVRPASAASRQVGALVQRKRGASSPQQKSKRPNMGPALLPTTTLGSPTRSSARLPAPIRPYVSASLGAPSRLQPIYRTPAGASQKGKTLTLLIVSCF